MSMIMDLLAEGLMGIQAMAEATPEQLQAKIDVGDDTDTAKGPVLHAIATAIRSGPGEVPYDKDGLLAQGINEEVVHALMQQVFGSTQIVLGIHARKVVCALDMIDWEDTGATTKTEIKMAKIRPVQVEKSLKTWLPHGDGLEFQKTVQGLGKAIGIPKMGSWGRIKAMINKRYSTKDKKIVIKLAEDIACFYNATKSGGRRKQIA